MQDSQRPEEIYREDLRSSASRFPDRVAESLSVQAGLVDSLLESAREILILTDPSLRVVRANAFTASLTGYAAVELVGRRLSRLIDGDDGGERLSAAAASLESAEHRHSGDYLVVGKSGLRIPARLTLRRLEDRQGQAYGHLVAGYPINDAPAGVTAASCADASNGLVERMLHGISDPVLLVDPFTQTILDCNAVAEAFFGRTRDEVVGAGLLTLYPDEESYRDVGQRSSAAYARGGVFQAQTVFRKKDGTALHCEITNIALFGSDGAMSFVIVLIRDIGPEKRREAELARLISRVSDLSAELGRLASTYESDRAEEASLTDLGFTPRQAQIARLIVTGASTKEVGFRLGLSDSTVKNHLAAMFRKLGVASRVDLVRVLTDRRVRLT